MYLFRTFWIAKSVNGTYKWMRDETTREDLKSDWCRHSVAFIRHFLTISPCDYLLLRCCLVYIPSRHIHVHVKHVMWSYSIHFNFICIAISTKDTKHRHRNTPLAHTSSDSGRRDRITACLRDAFDPICTRSVFFIHSASLNLASWFLLQTWLLLEFFFRWSFSVFPVFSPALSMTWWFSEFTHPASLSVTTC